MGVLNRGQPVQARKVIADREQERYLPHERRCRRRRGWGWGDEEAGGVAAEVEDGAHDAREDVFVVEEERVGEHVDASGIRMRM